MKTHCLGFPRIGADRELKKALESYWSGRSSKGDLLETGKRLRLEGWERQKGLSMVPAGDFSFYDQVLDMSFTLGNVPSRAARTPGDDLDRYFRLARGQSAGDGESARITAGEMTKWFDTNYHYIVPEFSDSTRFALNADRLLGQIDEAEKAGFTPRPVIIGPVTYLRLGKCPEGFDKTGLFEDLTACYAELLDALAARGLQWVQIDEPVLVTDVGAAWADMIRLSCRQLCGRGIKVMLTSYFGGLGDNRELALSLPVDALHVDAVRGRDEIEGVVDLLPAGMELSLGVIDGRNIWKANLAELLDFLVPIAGKLGERLWLAPSGSLLHVPVDLDREDGLDEELKSWMAFAAQKIGELGVLGRALSEGPEAVKGELAGNASALEGRDASKRVRNPAVRARLEEVEAAWEMRGAPYAERAAIQRERLGLPPYPTTTIGSYPQTREIRAVRRKFRRGEISQEEYTAAMHREIRKVVDFQEEAGLDVLVHGEPERNDMVEYFGEQLEGFAFSRFGWVQSYGSRCVKPPILFGDVARPRPMTVDWISYAQSITKKPMKGMLTGPVTILNWSFVRDDQPRALTCRQVALAIRDEVMDLEKAGISVIQIDEAALREGLPLQRNRRGEYLEWAVAAFRLTANGVGTGTQIHTHMCYSEFNDIIDAITAMDADVITIEASRSGMELLRAFKDFTYPNEIGPGVYDVHSPNVPSVESIVERVTESARRIPKERLWINPDCGLKTRGWPEIEASLKNMVEAAVQLRAAGG